MKKFALFFLVISAISQTVAQNDFYWYKNARQQLVLDKHRQYFTVKSMSDADSIKKELNAIGIGNLVYNVQLISAGEVLDAKPLVME